MPAGRVPEPPSLLPRETRDAFYALLTDIRGADTYRELMLHMGRAVEAQRDLRDYFTRIENELLQKLAEFLEEDGNVTSLRSTSGE